MFKVIDSELRDYICCVFVDFLNFGFNADYILFILCLEFHNIHTNVIKTSHTHIIFYVQLFFTIFFKVLVGNNVQE